MTTPAPPSPNAPSPEVDAPGPSAGDWGRIALLISLWGSAFALVDVAVREAPPSAVVMGRLWIGALIVTTYSRHRGRRLPPLFPRPDPAWIWLALLGVAGNTLPFTLISWGQQTITSALAGVLMAAMPLITVALAHFFVPGERLTPRKAVGFAVGFVGVVILIGPGVLADLGGPAALAQLAVLAGAASYALAAILARRSPPLPPSVTASGMLLCAATLATPPGVAALVLDPTPGGFGTWGAVAALGVGATGIASIFLMQVIRTAGPGFLSLTNYLLPVTAVAIGAVALGETITATMALGLVVVLAGVFLGSRRG